MSPTASDEEGERLEITQTQLVQALRKSLKLRVITQTFPISLVMEAAAELEVDDVFLDVIREVLMAVEAISTTISGRSFLDHLEDLSPLSSQLFSPLELGDLMPLTRFFESLFVKAREVHLVQSVGTQSNVTDIMGLTSTGGTIASGITTNVDALACLLGPEAGSSTAYQTRGAPHTLMPCCSMQTKKNGNCTSLKLESEVGPLLFQFKLFNTRDVVGIPFTERYQRALMNGQISCDQNDPLWKMCQQLAEALRNRLLEKGARENTFQAK